MILSYPDLHNPKPYKGKIYYRTDVLMKTKSATFKELHEAINDVCVEAFGDDESEWPSENIKGIQNGNEREDSQGYKGNMYITASTQTPVPVVDMEGHKFNPQAVKGGMFANVAVTISAWEFDGDEGISIYLQGVQIDTSKESLNFGGGRSVKQMFNVDADDDQDEDQEEEKPTRKAKASRYEDEEDEEEKPSRAKKRPSYDDEDEKPARKKKASRYDDEEEEDDNNAEPDYDDQDGEEEDFEPKKPMRKAMSKKSSKHSRNEYLD